MRVKYSWMLVFMVFMGVSALAQNPKKHIRAGNKAYKEGKFADAEVDYRKAVAADSNYAKGQFNLGDAMYQQKNMKESANIYGGLAENATDSDIKSKSLYNYGNTMLGQKKYKEALEAYKKSLLMNPNDQDAKYNYEYARKKMIQQQKQQKKNQKNNKNKKDQKKDKNKKQNKDKKNQKKDQKNKKDQKKDKKQDQKNQNNQKKDKKDQEDQQGKKGDQQKQNKPQKRPVQMSKKDAQRMLKALKNDEKKTLYKLQKAKAKAKASNAKKSDIDW